MIHSTSTSICNGAKVTRWYFTAKCWLLENIIIQYETTANTNECTFICSDAGVIEGNLFTVLHDLLTVICLPASWHQKVDCRLVRNRSYVLGTFSEGWPQGPQGTCQGMRSCTSMRAKLCHSQIKITQTLCGGMQARGLCVARS